MSTNCPKCGGVVDDAVVSGIVSLKRSRTPMATGKVSALRAEVCTVCGYAELYAAKPERLFSDYVAEAKSQAKKKGKGKKG